MAEGGGFFRRLSNLFRGFMNLWISDVEKEHPEIAYENAINSLIEKFTKLKRATAAIIRRRDEISERLTKQSTELAQASQDLDVAVQTAKDDLALILIQKKNLLEKEVAELKAEAETAGKDADSAKAALLQVQAEIKKLKAEKDNMLAKMESAQARVRIQEQLDGLSVDAEVKALDNVRTHIKNTIAQASLGQELAESSLDSRLAALRAQSGEVTARNQLDELKREGRRGEGRPEDDVGGRVGPRPVPKTRQRAAPRLLLTRPGPRSCGGATCAAKRVSSSCTATCSTWSNTTASCCPCRST